MRPDRAAGQGAARQGAAGQGAAGQGATGQGAAAPAPAPAAAAARQRSPLARWRAGRWERAKRSELDAQSERFYERIARGDPDWLSELI